MSAGAAAGIAGPVELLDRSLSYTRVALALVGPGRLGEPTPCTRWDLGALLDHMDDALDAFTEAATGSVTVVRTPGVPTLAAAAPPQLESIRAKACALLGWWCEHPPADVRVGGVPLPAGLLVGTAALEITVHGWDVHRAVGSNRPLPESLAAALLPVAELTVGEDDRPARFGAALPVAADAPAATRLLAHLGRG